MAKKEYAFYPGCSSQLKASASNYLTSVNAMCKTLDVKLTPIPDWNCCGASISYTGAGELTRHVLNARNFALAENIGALDVKLTPADVASLSSALPPGADKGTRYPEGQMASLHI